MNRIAVFGLAMMLTGCGVAAVSKASTDYNQSLASYKQCVMAKGPDQCRGEKAILDADAQRYESTSAALNGGGSGNSYRPAVYQPVGGGTVVRY